MWVGWASLGLGAVGLLLTVAACIWASRRGQSALITLGVSLLMTPLAGLGLVAILPDRGGQGRAASPALALKLFGGALALLALPWVILFVVFAAYGRG
jgi:hypothetical protein